MQKLPKFDYLQLIMWNSPQLLTHSLLLLFL